MDGDEVGDEVAEGGAGGEEEGVLRVGQESGFKMSLSGGAEESEVEAGVCGRVGGVGGGVEVDGLGAEDVVLDLVAEFGGEAEEW